MREDSTAAIKIASVRSALAMNQETFAKHLAVGQGVVSAWERGEYAPSAESYAKLTKLAAECGLFSEARWFLEHVGIGRTELLAIVKESRDKRGAAYRQGLIDAQAEYPDDALAQRRYADKFQKRALRRKTKKKE
jgi:transcriptional regulator with XRE-family HTH domain